MMASLLLAAFGAASTVQLQLPPELVLEPVSVEELAGATAVAWDGEPLPPLGVVVRRVQGAFRLLLPPGVAPSSFELAAQVKELKNAESKGGRVAAKVTVLPLRLVESRGDLEVWEADLVLYLDLSHGLAGTLVGRLEVSLLGR